MCTSFFFFLTNLTANTHKCAHLVETAIFARSIRSMKTFYCKLTLSDCKCELGLHVKLKLKVPAKH